MKTIEQELREQKERERLARKSLQERMRPVFVTIEDLESGKIRRRREPVYENTPIVDRNQPKFGGAYEVTMADILATLSDKKTTGVSRRRSKVSKILSEIDVASEVRIAFQTKFGTITTLPEATRDKLTAKLKEMVVNQVSVPSYDELRLVGMARAIVASWKPKNKLW